MKEEQHELEGERGTASLAGVIGLSLISMGLALAVLTTNQGQVQHSRLSRELAIVRYAALAGANDALAEIRLGTDGVGERAGGLGRLGVNAPIVYNDNNGNPVGEYVTYVINRAADPVNDAPEYYIRVMAAVPSFAAEQANGQGARGFGMEFRLQSEVTFSLAPNLGAISYAGPVDAWDLRSWENSGFNIDGGDYPAVVFTDGDAYDDFIDIVKDEWTSGWDVSDNITGAPMQTQAEGDSAEFEGPFSLQSEAAFDAQTLNDYREALREYAQELAFVTENTSGSKNENWGGLDAATGRLADYVRNGVTVKTTILHTHPDVKNGAGTNKPRITQDFDFPLTPGVDTNVVVIDSSKFQGGSDQVTDNHGRTITGAGTLVVLHPIGSKTDNANGKQFNLDWDGDVIVVGYPDDTTSGVGNNSRTDNLLYISRADWNVDGNVILLSSGTTEASLEMRGTGSDTANLTVNGSLLLFAEATGREAEIDIEGNANMTVNGIVGVYGKRAELENQDAGTGTNWTINGTLAVGLPDDNNTTSARLDVDGQANFNFNLDNVNSATENLAELQADLNFQNEIPNGFTYGAQSWLLENKALYTNFEGDLPARVLAGEDLFVDTDLMTANRQ